ncbi:MAG TPA: Lrp/AsnC family transcriptional regulator [Candidatus Coproplasma avistercoris]|nr:Lrp/AsnC family transcriptional regulator [Candidatus Coproplasma avistercoris]
MDKLKQDILSIIAEDSRLSAANIAAMIGASEQDVRAAIAELESAGVIVKYTALINENLTESERVEALIEVKVTPQRGHGFDTIAAEIAAHPEVKNLYLMSGAYDLAVIVESASLRAVSRFVSECISTYENVISTATHFILKKYKVEGALMQDNDGGRLSIQP